MLQLSSKTGAYFLVVFLLAQRLHQRERSKVDVVTALGANQCWMYVFQYFPVGCNQEERLSPNPSDWASEAYLRMSVTLATFERSLLEHPRDILWSKEIFPVLPLKNYRMEVKYSWIAWLFITLSYIICQASAGTR